MEEEIVISTKDLAIGYSSKRKKNVLIKDINIDIPKGKLTAVIGLNGSGKSTFIRTLAKQQPKLEGSFVLNSQDSSKFSTNEWAKQIAWVQTDVSTSLNLSVKEFISLGRQPYTNWFDSITTKDNEIIDNVIKITNLTFLQNKKCNELSDGQLQRVYIARALAQDTPVIILDEPTTHLDIINKANTLDLLKTLCKTQNKTIIYSTHEIEYSLQVTDYMICISEKEIFINSVNDIIKNETLNYLFKSKKIFFDKALNRFMIS